MNPAELINALTAHEKNLLRTLRERDSDGYSLLRHSRLEAKEAEAAIDSLLQKGLINVEGTPRGPELNFAYFWVRPEARGYADFVTGRSF